MRCKNMPKKILIEVNPANTLIPPLTGKTRYLKNNELMIDQAQQQGEQNACLTKPEFCMARCKNHYCMINKHLSLARFNAQL